MIDKPYPIARPVSSFQFFYLDKSKQHPKINKNHSSYFDPFFLKELMACVKLK